MADGIGLGRLYADLINGFADRGGDIMTGTHAVMIVLVVLGIVFFVAHFFRP